jgi:hypothetical protein
LPLCEGWDGEHHVAHTHGREGEQSGGGGVEPKSELEKQGFIRFPTECWVALTVDGWEYHRAPMAERNLFSEAPDPDDAASGENGAPSSHRPCETFSYPTCRRSVSALYAVIRRSPPPPLRRTSLLHLDDANPDTSASLMARAESPRRCQQPASNVNERAERPVPPWRRRFVCILSSCSALVRARQSIEKAA